MPVYHPGHSLDAEKHRQNRGELIVRFDIKFPTFLSEEEKTEL